MIHSRKQRVIQRDIRDDGVLLCSLCGRPIDLDIKDGPLRFSLDHVVPKSRGGSNHVSNLKAAHAQCNSVKGDSMRTDCIETRDGRVSRKPPEISEAGQRKLSYLRAMSSYLRGESALPSKQQFGL